MMDTDTNQNVTTPTSPTTPTEPASPAPIPDQAIEVKDPAARFRGSGTSFKAKLIGIDDVPESRGDKMCQESILKLKAAVKASGQHKQKIIVNVSLKGLRIINLLNGEVEHEHPVHRISFIARDLTDRRAFGYIYGPGEGKHKFFGIKTAKIAEHLVLALRDLFQVVYDMKKKEMEQAKQEAQNDAVGTEEETYAVPNNKPAPQAQGSSLLDIEQQLQDIQQVAGSDAFNPWPENTPTSPDTPGASNGDSLFGMPNLSDISSLSSEFSLASASSTFAESKPNASDSRSPQSEQFHRTSSGKSAISWHGRGSAHHWPSFKSERKKRHGSIDAQTGIHSLNAAEKPPTGKTLLKSNSIGQADLPKRETTCKEHQHNMNVSESKTDSSFFEEVMVATGIKSNSSDSLSHTAPATDDKVKPVEKGHADASENVSDSMSSVSSTNSKTSTPRKSLSITNLFFSPKSDRNKNSLKRKNKHQSQQKSAPNNAVLSEDDAHAQTTHSATTLPPTSARLQRTSSSSSTTSSEKNPAHKLTRGYSSASISSVPDTSKMDIRTNERVPPPASVARARPRAQSSMSLRVANVDSHNPPMFKTKGGSKLQKHSSMSSIDSQHSTSSQSALSTVPDDSPMPIKSWAQFDELPQAPEKSNDSNSNKEQLSEKADSAWSSGVCEISKKGIPNEVDSFNDSFSPLPAEKGTDKNCASEEPTKSEFSASVFENCDPFGDLELEDPLKDPFSNVADIFGSMLTDTKFSDSETMPASRSPADTNEPSDLTASNTGTVANKEIFAETDQKDVDNTIPPPPAIISSCEEFHSSDEYEPTSHTSDNDHATPPRTPSPKPPPLPPRIPKRPVVTPVEEESLPPSIPPPPLPPRSEINTSDDHDVDTSSDSDGQEEHTEPPDCKPPDLPQINGLPPVLGENYPPIPSRNPAKPPALTASINTSNPGSLGLPSDLDEPEEKSEAAAGNGLTKNASYSDELSSAFNMPAEQPAPVPGGKLTKDQIIASFNMPGMNQGMPAQAGGGYYGQPAPRMQPPQQQMFNQPSSVPSMGIAAASMPASNPFAQGFPASQAPMGGGMFPSGPSPAVPARPGAMRPPAPTMAQTGAAQNPFGDALSPTADVMSPMSNAPAQQNGSTETAKPSDPFESLVPGMGGSKPVNKKDMFKNFQMAKPQPPPRSGDSVSPNFENYLLQSVGGVPLDDANNNAAPKQPTPAPRSTSQDQAFGGAPANGPSEATGGDPFGMFGGGGSGGASGFDQPFNFNSPPQVPQQQQQQNDMASLFG